MKKLVTLFLACLLLIFTAGCTPPSSDTQSNQTSTNPYISNSPKTLTTSEKERIAEQQALQKIYEYMNVQHSQFFEYNIDATRFKIGAITHYGNDFEVTGTLYLYDNYGDLADTATFYGRVVVNDDGSYRAYYPEIKIK